MYTRFLYPSPVANGDDWFQVGEPTVVGVNELDELSKNGEPDTVFNKNLVFVIAVNGPVGTVIEVDDAV